MSSLLFVVAIGTLADEGLDYFLLQGPLSLFDSVQQPPCCWLAHSNSHKIFCCDIVKMRYPGHL